MQYNKWIRDWKTALAENFFLRSLCLLLGIGLILNATVFRSKERIIISPPQITKEFWLEANKASPEYLEQMGAFFATLGGNLSPASAEFNVSTLLGYINSPSHAEMKRDLSAQAQYIKKHNITQAYFPSAMNVDRENGVVSVTGEVVRNIGTVRIDKEEMVIRMKFTMDNYKLWLQEFYTEYPGRSKEDKDKGHNKATEKAKTKDIP
ncbi:MAG: type IV conjugative transfer system protein TraE [Syntrophus sp. (in: bacteria)]